MLKLHLGCGSNPFKGWDNLDLNANNPDVIEYDLRKPLPYEDFSVDFIFNEHFIEHLTDSEGTLFLKECYRVLKKGGVLRVSCPDLAIIVGDYVNRKLDRYDILNHKYRNQCHLLNMCCRNWGHMYMYDEEDLTYKFKSIGFSEIKREKYHESSHEELKNLECRINLEELILEGIK